MPSISNVRRSVRLPRNLLGRDLVVGDLHGHCSLLEEALVQIGFDPTCDRVFSVGDLIDRGPESMATLSLVEQPWFHAVLGNHELMLLNCLGYYQSRVHSRKAYRLGGGEWIKAALSRHRKLVGRLADRVAAMPLSIHVASDIPFNVAHAEGHGVAWERGPSSDQLVSVHQADDLTSSREGFAVAISSGLSALRFMQHSVQVSDTPIGEQSLTYVGHSPVRSITVHDSCVYIDQGVGVRTGKKNASTPVTLLDHSRFALWLDGVSAACRRTSSMQRQPALECLAIDT